MAGGLNTGRTRLGKPNEWLYNGSKGVTDSGRPNAKWVLKNLGADVRTNYINHFPRIQDELIVSVNGVEQVFGTASDPRDIVFTIGNLAVPAFFVFEDGKEPSDGDNVTIEI